MPSFLPTRMIGGSITQEIAASPDVVWETCTDMENATKILSNLKSLDVVKNGNEGSNKVGMVLKEVRIWHGQEMESFNTITSMSTNPYSVSTNVYLKQKYALSGKDNAARIGSWTIVEGNSSNSSVFVWTYSAYPASLCESISTLFCGPCVIHSIKKHFEQDLQEYAAEAEKRQALIDKKSERDDTETNDSS